MTTTPTSADAATTPLVEIRDLSVTFTTAAGVVEAVKNASLTIYPGQSVAIVGESGSGKSTTAHAIINLLPGTGKISGGSIRFDGRELVGASKKDIVNLRGKEIGLVPQDPMSNLNPVWRIGFQIKEALTANGVDSKRRRRQLADGITAAEAAEAAERANPDDDLYLGLAAKTALLDKLRASGVAADVVTRADTDLRVGSTTRRETAAILKGLGVADGDALAAEHVVGASTTDRVAGLLAEAGLADAVRRARQYPHEFSGGMRQRALIAMGLAATPKLLIADEPTSALDVTVQKKILDHLETLTSELGTAVLFITHDLGLAAERAEHLVVMYKGEVVESGPSRQILKDPQHPYTRRLVAAAPSLASRRIQSAHAAGVESEELLAHAASGDERTGGDIAVEVKDLTKVFKIRGSRPGASTDFTAVDNISFQLPKGTTLALVGESGSGKSTAANMVLGLLEPTRGTVEFDGVDITTLKGKDAFEFRRRIQPVFQNPYGSLDPMFSIYRSIEEPLRLHKVGDAKSRETRVRELLDMVALPASMMRRFPNELSGGQRQRIAVARALALKPDVLVLDEAVSALDVLVQAQVLTLLNDLQAQLGVSYLFITHDLAVVRQIADEVAVMQSGKVVEKGPTDTIFDSPTQDYTKELLAAIPGASLEIGYSVPSA